MWLRTAGGGLWQAGSGRRTRPTANSGRQQMPKGGRRTADGKPRPAELGWRTEGGRYCAYRRRPSRPMRATLAPIAMRRQSPLSDPGPVYRDRYRVANRPAVGGRDVGVCTQGQGRRRRDIGLLRVEEYCARSV